MSAALVVVMAVLMLIEELLWTRLNRALAWLGHLPLLRDVEHAISRLPWYAAMPLFLIPVIALIPFKLGALWLMANGHVLLGVQVFILAKVVGTALAARLFVLCRPALMSRPWFAHTYEWVMYWRARLYASVRAMPFYRRAKRALRRARRTLRAMLHRGGSRGAFSVLARRWRALARLRRMRRMRRPD